MHINPDHFLQTEHGRIVTPQRNTLAWEKSFHLLKNALQLAGSETRVYVMVGAQGSGKSSWVKANALAHVIFFDAILVKRSERLPIILAAKAQGVAITAVWLRTPLAICIARNAARPADERVSEQAICNVYAAIEPPDLCEGFDEILASDCF